MHSKLMGARLGMLRFEEDNAQIDLSMNVFVGYVCGKGSLH